jgi:hypothetical protein
MALNNAPSLDDALHRQENHEAPISASSFEMPLSRLLRMRKNRLPPQKSNLTTQLIRNVYV